MIIPHLKVLGDAWRILGDDPFKNQVPGRSRTLTHTHTHRRLIVRLGSLGFPADCLAAKASEEVDDAHGKDRVSTLRAELSGCFNIGQMICSSAGKKIEMTEPAAPPNRFRIRSVVIEVRGE